MKLVGYVESCATCIVMITIFIIILCVIHIALFMYKCALLWFIYILNEYHEGQLIYFQVLIIAGINTGTSIYAGLAIFSVLGYMAKEQGVDISNVTDKGITPWPISLLLLIPHLLATFVCNSSMACHWDYSSFTYVWSCPLTIYEWAISNGSKV